MFSLFRTLRELTDANRRILDLQDQVRMQQKLAESRLNELNELQNKIEDSSRSCSVVIDFAFMEAFSIERVNDCNGTRTVIGYVKPIDEDKSTVAEWTISCNEALHEELVKEFRRVKGL